MIRIIYGKGGKFKTLVTAFPDVWHGLVLDVGCRSGGLARFLDSSVTYLGLDLKPPAQVIGNVDLGMPFGDQAADTIAALDVLEHTEKIHQNLAELCRVARRFVLIALPNQYHWRKRWLFLRGKPPSGKYGLPQDYPPDRHRWIFNFSEAAHFCRHGAEQNGFEVVSEAYAMTDRFSRPTPAILTHTFPNLFCPVYVVLLRRRRG